MSNLNQTSFKQRIIPILILVIGIAGAIFLFRQNAQKNAALNVPAEVKVEAKNVGVQTAAQSRTLKEMKSYPALVASDQEATITAKASGTITSLNFDLGDKVSAGKVLATIDDSGNNLGEGKNDFQSLQIQQLELGVKQAKESLDLAKDNDKALNTNATDSAKKIAELQLKNAKLALQSALDSHSITATLAGSVIQKSVSVGDSVTLGQPLATIANLNQMKFQFYVDETDLKSFKLGTAVNVKDNQGNTLPARISHISPQADSSTRRFLVEAVLTKVVDPLLGTVVNVEFETLRTAQTTDSIILPLSAINIGQNENSIFIVDNGHAKKVIVSLKKIVGETAEISAQDFSPETQIIISGNKLLQDQDLINIQ